MKWEEEVIRIVREKKLISKQALIAEVHKRTGVALTTLVMLSSYFPTLDSRIGKRRERGKILYYWKEEEVLPRGPE